MLQHLVPRHDLARERGDRADQHRPRQVDREVEQGGEAARRAAEIGVHVGVGARLVGEEEQHLAEGIRALRLRVVGVPFAEDERDVRREGARGLGVRRDGDDPPGSAGGQGPRQRPHHERARAAGRARDVVRPAPRAVALGGDGGREVPRGDHAPIGRHLVGGERVQRDRGIEPGDLGGLGVELGDTGEVGERGGERFSGGGRHAPRDSAHARVEDQRPVSGAGARRRASRAASAGAEGAAQRLVRPMDAQLHGRGRGVRDVYSRP